MKLEGGEPTNEEPELRLQSEVLEELRNEIDGIFKRNDFKKSIDYVIVKDDILKEYIDIQIRPGTGNVKRQDYELKKVLWDKMQVALTSAEEFPKSAEFKPGPTFEVIRVWLKDEIARRRIEPKKEKTITTPDEPVSPPEIPVIQEEPVPQNNPFPLEIKEKEPQYDMEILLPLYFRLLKGMSSDMQLVIGEHFLMDPPRGDTLEFKFVPKYGLKNSALRMKALEDYFAAKFGPRAVEPYFPIEVEIFGEDKSILFLNVIPEYVKQKIEKENATSS